MSEIPDARTQLGAALEVLKDNHDIDRGVIHQHGNAIDAGKETVEWIDGVATADNCLPGALLEVKSAQEVGQSLEEKISNTVETVKEGLGAIATATDTHLKRGGKHIKASLDLVRPAKESYLRMHTSMQEAATGAKKSEETAEQAAARLDSVQSISRGGIPTLEEVSEHVSKIQRQSRVYPVGVIGGVVNQLKDDSEAPARLEAVESRLLDRFTELALESGNLSTAQKKLEQAQVLLNEGLAEIRIFNQNVAGTLVGLAADKQAVEVAGSDIKSSVQRLEGYSYGPDEMAGNANDAIEKVERTILTI